jgi:hypothetical protein
MKNINNNRGKKSSNTSNKTKSSLNIKPTTLNWNVNANRMPSFVNTISRDNRPYQVMQISNQGTVLSSNTSVAQMTAKQWSTTDIIQFSSYATVFDQYKIDFIELWLTPFGPATAPGYNSNIHIYSAVDYDDANAPTSLTAISQYENAVITRPSEGHYVKFRPHIAVAAYGGAFTQFKNEPSDWLDVASGAVQHYGFKFGAEATLANADLKLDMETRITISFRNVF